MSEPFLREYSPEDAEWLVPLHGKLYASEFGFDDTFAPLVASILADFSAAFDPAWERGWVAEAGGHPLGSIFCTRGPDVATAKLRLFILAPEARGMGLGRRLLDACMAFAKAAGYARMTLWTHAEHRAACALYSKFGWHCDDSQTVTSFGQTLTEQVWNVELAGLAIGDDGR